MADDPIDISKVRKMGEKDQEIAMNLHAMYHQIIETHNQLIMRAKDIEKDAQELLGVAEAILNTMAEKYPELFPAFDLDSDVE